MNTDMKPIKVQLDKGAYMPVMEHKDDAGADLRTPYGFTLWHGEYKGIDTGVHVEVPEGYMMEVRSKSGLMKNHGLFTDGTVDRGFSGSVNVFLFNFSNQIVKFSAGDKIAQIVFTKIGIPDFEQVDRITGGERGDAGFGSTGR